MNPTPKQIGPEVKPEECSPLNEAMCRYVHELERSLREQEALARGRLSDFDRAKQTISSLREQLRQRTAERDSMAQQQSSCTKASDTLRVICKTMHLDLKDGDDMTVALPPAIKKMLERDQKLSRLGCQLAEMRHRLSYEQAFVGDPMPQVKHLAHEFAQLCLAVPVQAAKLVSFSSTRDVHVDVPTGAKQVWARRLAGGVLQVGFTFRGIEVADSEGGTPD